MKIRHPKTAVPHVKKNIRAQIITFHISNKNFGVSDADYYRKVFVIFRIRPVSVVVSEFGLKTCQTELFSTENGK